MREDGLDLGGIGDEGDDSDEVGALQAKQQEALEHASQEFGPRPLSGRSCGEARLSDQVVTSSATIAARRFGLPSEFGDACAFLCSVQAGFISGQNLQLDGGSYKGLL